jgi:hypothetical protein
VCQPFHLLGQAVPSEHLKGHSDAGMEHPPLLAQQATVGYLLREGVLESVDELGKQAHLV